MATYIITVLMHYMHGDPIPYRYTAESTERRAIRLQVDRKSHQETCAAEMPDQRDMPFTVHMDQLSNDHRDEGYNMS